MKKVEDVKSVLCGLQLPLFSWTASICVLPQLKSLLVPRIFIIIVVFYLFYVAISFYKERSFQNLQQQVPFSNSSLLNPKTILYFTPYFELTDWGFGLGHEAFVRNNCPVTNCYITNNKSYFGDVKTMNRFDSILFHMRDMKTEGKIHFPSISARLSHQRYVMFMMESPLNDNFPYNKFGNFFNWTMTMRLDSDIPNPYGWVETVDDPKPYPPRRNELVDMTYTGNEGPPNVKVQTLKKGLVVWMVSNCGTHSQRENYVGELQKHIQVDIYGRCGKFSCDMRMHHKCLQELDKKYKFYLSFENSICMDYVTEKFWNALSMTSVVPVVMGGVNYSEIAPWHSYIDVKDFDSPAKLAEYLLYLNEHDEEYLKYFWWKSKYKVVLNKVNAICRLCEALNDPTLPVKNYSDLQTWWRGGENESNCLQKNNFPWSQFKPIPQESPSFLSAIFNIGSSLLKSISEAN